MSIQLRLRDRWSIYAELSRALVQGGLDPFAGMYRSILLFAAVATNKPIRVLLADDDEDDRQFFEEAVSEVAPNALVSTVSDGESLLLTLEKANPLPHVLFLDLNMPLKNGWECLDEIRANPKLRHLPVVIYSTSSSREFVDRTFNGGASLYVRKPDSYNDLKSVAKKVLSYGWHDGHTPPRRDQFVITF
jgi:CheY-like chemotaxis protein